MFFFVFFFALGSTLGLILSNRYIVIKNVIVSEITSYSECPAVVQ